MSGSQSGGVSSNVLALTGSGLDVRWNFAAPLGTSTALTYSFSTSLPSYSDPDPRPSFAAFTAQQQAHARTALQAWGSVSGITFVEVPNAVGGEIRFAFASLADRLDGFFQPRTSTTYLPTASTRVQGDTTTVTLQHNTIRGDTFLDSGLFAGSDSALAPGQRGYAVLLQAVGNAIGLKHPALGTPRIEPAFDSAAFTVLSNNRPNNTTTLGTLDLEAVRLLYGTTDIATSYNSATNTLTRTGTAAQEWVLGTELADVLAGADGADTMHGQIGGDTLDGGAGGDSLNGGGDDDHLVGGAGDDTLVGGDSQDTLLGGDGYDVASYAQSADAVSVSLLTGRGSAGEAGGDTLTGIESLRGSRFADVLTGNDDHNIIEGGAGADTIDGRSGNDWASFENAGGAIAINLDAGLGWAGDATDDRIFGIENLRGSMHGDFLFGDTGANILRGDEGGDTLYGGGNSDTIFYSTSNAPVQVDLSRNAATGGHAAGDMLISVENVFATPFNDVLIGDSASNTLVGWFGVDTMTGNGSNDIFRWTSTFDSGVAAGQRDWVTDFWRDHGDLLDFSGIDANAGIDGDQAFAFIGNAAFSAAGQLRWFHEGANTVVQVNTDANLAADMAILLSRNIALGAQDFLL